MLPIKPLTRRALMAVAPGVIICVRLPEAAAENPGDNKNQRPISIAVQDFADSATSELNLHDLTAIIISDLKASGRFVFVESDNASADDGNVIPQFDRWRSTHADGLVTGRITRKPDQRILVEFRLWDVAIGQQLMGAQYALQLDDWRHVAHLIAEAIIEQLVGRT